jgi:unsaturated rhamnogalacturonyl hydrolase
VGDRTLGFDDAYLAQGGQVRRRTLLGWAAAGGMAAAAGLSVPAGNASAAGPAGVRETPSELFAQWRADRGNDRHIPDVSYAGYAAREVPVPTVRTAVQAREFGAVPDGRDNTEAIQTAIINAALRGGGAVQLEAGDYRCHGVIRLNCSGVVLRGAGQSETRLVFTRSLKQVIGQNLEDGKSQWSWSGALVWVGPTDTFNTQLQILDWAGRPVNTSGNRTTDWEQWRSGGNGEGKRLARVLDDRIRGSTQVRVDNPAGLKQGSYALMTWRSRGAEGDFGLMKRLGGDKLMSSRFPWASADRMYAPATPRYRWPVRIKKIDGDRVTLAQPVRIDITAAELDTDFQRLGPVIIDCGVEALTIVTNGSRDPNETHLHDHGCNGIFFNRVIDCWARDVTIERPENGILFSCAKSVTVERFTIRADSSVQVHHATAVRSFSADILQRDFTVNAQRVFHGVNHEWMSSGCVWSRGRLVNGTFDSHRGLPFDNVRTEITLERTTGARGAGVYAGPRNGRRIVHWNIDNRGTSGAAVLEPDAFTSSAMVGVRGPRKTGCADGMVCGDKNVLEVATGQVPNPDNLHDAQVAVRMAELLPSRAEVVHTARRVGDYWMRANPAPGSNEWNNSTYHSGNLALWRLTGDGRYLDHTLAWARFHNWGLHEGITTRNADNHLAGEVYLELYGVTQEPVRIAAIEKSIRRMVFTDRPAKNDDWWWVDALHMAMPVFARLGALHGDNAFWEKMFRLYTHTKRVEGGPGLYSDPHELWYRDRNYVSGRKTTPGGRPVFWSRGNGWAMMAHAKVLRVLPASEPHTQEYRRNLESVSRSLRALQSPDGFWNVSLVDSAHFGGPEASGTAMHLYGLASGIRMGVLDRATHLPAVVRAWNALADTAVRADGLLGWVQRVGHEPDSSQPVTTTTTADFAVGAFLLAAEQVAALM